MQIDESITQWIDQLRDGDSAAAQNLWETYFVQMVDLARRRLAGAPRQVSDEEDVALSAFKSFCIGAREGKFTQLTDRTNLWPLLIAITANKAVDVIRYNNRSKRGGGSPVAEEGRIQEGRVRAERVSLDEVFSTEPSPEFAIQLADEFEQLLSRLEAALDLDLPKIAVWKMDGDSNVEIAERLGCTRRTVERKLKLIASLWSTEAGQ